METDRCAEAEKHCIAGDELLDQGRLNEATIEYSKAIELQPEHEGAHSGRGMAYQGLSEFQKAIEDYSTNIRLDPDWAEAYELRAMIYSQLNMHAEAQQDIDRAIEVAKQDVNRAIERGEYLEPELCRLKWFEALKGKHYDKRRGWVSTAEST